MKGLTLVEVLIAMGIATVVGALLLVIIVNSTGLFLQQSSKIEQGVGTNDALSAVRNSVKEASSIASDYPPNFTTSSTQLVLKLTSVDASGNLIPDSFDYFAFFKDQSNFILQSFPDPLSSRKSQDRILLTGLESLEFKYYNLANPPAEVPPVSAAKVKITLFSRENTATTEANLRND